MKHRKERKMNNKPKMKKEIVCQPRDRNCNYDTTPDLDKLANVWNILNEMNLAGVLDGKIVEIEFETLLNHILRDGKANELCQAITDTADNFKKTPLQEVVNLIKSFFTDTKKAFAGLSISSILQILPPQ